MNSRRIGLIKNKLFLGFIGFLIFLYIPIFTEILLPTKIAETYAVKLAVSKVLIAQFFSKKLTGAYWEDELYEQALIVHRLPLEERLNFFALIIMNCDLDASRATIFSDIIEKDAFELGTYLINLKFSSDFKNLSLVQQLRITQWIQELNPRKSD